MPTGDDRSFDLSAFLRSGVVVVVATADADNRPEIARGWGPRLAEGPSLTLCVGAAPDSKTRENLERGVAMAVTLSVPTTYRTIQLKGPVLDVAEPSVEDLARVDEHVAEFAAQAAQVGVSQDRSWRLREPALLAVRMAIRERYEQTPGPRAGMAL